MRMGVANWRGAPFEWQSGFIINTCGPGPLQFHVVPELEPGQAITRTFSMCIHPSAQIGEQYLKVSVNRFFNCYDNCYGGRNFAEKAVWVYQR